MSVFVAFDAGVIKFRLGFSIFAYGAHEIGLTFKMMDRATFLLARLLSLSFSLLLTLFSLSSLLLSYRFGPSWAFRDGLSVSSFPVMLEKCPIFFSLFFYLIHSLSLSFSFSSSLEYRLGRKVNLLHIFLFLIMIHDPKPAMA